MKMTAVLLSLLLGAFSQAQASTLVFKCDSSIMIDQNETAQLGMAVSAQGSSYTSVLIGTADTAPVETTKQAVSFADSLNIPGVKNIIAATKLSRKDYSKIAQVEVFTAGNFEDDAAGVRGAQFLDAQGASLASGMFFGWAGAVKCK
jgi:hypothetical protein